MQLIDSHLHLCDDTLFPLSDDLIQKALNSGVEKMVVICTNPLEMKRGFSLKERWNENLFLVAGTTPHESHLLGEDFGDFEQAARAGKLVGLGETGLEYHHHPETKAIQTVLLKRYLSLAEELKLPVVIHCRDGFSDLFKVLDQFPYVKGVLHCFTGKMEDAKELVARHWMVSMSGILTFKNSLELQEIAAWIPLKNLLIETDAPYLAPHPFRGKMNEPSYLPEICKKVAALKTISGDEVAEATSQNASQLFSLGCK